MQGVGRKGGECEAGHQSRLRVVRVEPVEEELELFPLQLLLPESALFVQPVALHGQHATCWAVPTLMVAVTVAVAAVPAAAAVRLPPPKKKARDPHGPKQPWTAFNLFSVEEGRRVSRELREGGRGGFGKELGERWRRLSAEQREPWKELERQDKARYEAELATYLASPSRVTCSPPTAPAAPTIAAALSVHTGLHTGGTPHVALSLALRRADLANLPAHLPASSALPPPSVGLRSTPQAAEAAAALLPYFESDGLASAAGQADFGGSSAPATQLVLAEAIPGGAPAKGAPARRRRACAAWPLFGRRRICRFFRPTRSSASSQLHPAASQRLQGHRLQGEGPRAAARKGRCGRTGTARRPVPSPVHHRPVPPPVHPPRACSCCFAQLPRRCATPWSHVPPPPPNSTLP
mmetsp:Transcript_26096/g.82663  ORF Transcript_26096/g.82663 Transcript_26096/m.82663 type:complete len:408 (+) Transcript_26096:96-1319(+)